MNERMEIKLKCFNLDHKLPIFNQHHQWLVCVCVWWWILSFKLAINCIIQVKWLTIFSYFFLSSLFFFFSSVDVTIKHWFCFMILGAWMFSDAIISRCILLLLLLLSWFGDRSVMRTVYSWDCRLHFTDLVHEQRNR